MLACLDTCNLILAHLNLTVSKLRQLLYPKWSRTSWCQCLPHSVTCWPKSSRLTHWLVHCTDHTFSRSPAAPVFFCLPSSSRCVEACYMSGWTPPLASSQVDKVHLGLCNLTNWNSKSDTRNIAWQRQSLQSFYVSYMFNMIVSDFWYAFA